MAVAVVVALYLTSRPALLYPQITIRRRTAGYPIAAVASS
jgi:hypothetical protein